MTISKSFFLSLLILVLSLVSLHAAKPPSGRVVTSFDLGWRFMRGNEPGAELPECDDKAWRALDVPHDWSIEGPFGRHNADGGMLAWLPAGVGWYRKHFTLPEGDAKRRVFIEFDGVMANSEVWINGFSLGKRPYGYVSFRYELTGHLNFGDKPNVLAVKVDDSAQPASRWYSGAGIYRHVRLVVTEPVHLEHWGVVVTPEIVEQASSLHGGTSGKLPTSNAQLPTSKQSQGESLEVGSSLLGVGSFQQPPKAARPSDNRSEAEIALKGKAASTTARVKVRSTVVNQSDEKRKVTVRVTVWTPEGKALKPVESTEEVEAGVTRDFSNEIAVEKAELWDVEKPNLYRAVVEVLDAGEKENGKRRLEASAPLDSETVTFGIREARFEAATGFWLNGRNMKIKGACLHHDGGALGAAVPLRAWERRLELLRGVGVNAIRTAHNPVAPEFLDLCDRMGFLVVDEFFDCWTMGKKDFDYHVYFPQWHEADTRDTVRRDRNHPSIILYSAGNEIFDTQNAALAKDILGALLGIIHAEDPTRPVTMGIWRPGPTKDYENGFADMLDVIGETYNEGELFNAHQQKPSRKIIGMENSHDRRAWLFMRDNAAFSGQFIWSGFDYLGDTIKWGHIGWGTGLFDRAGRPYTRAYERQSWWSDAPMVHAVRRVAAPKPNPGSEGNAAPKPREATNFADWTPPDQAPHEESVEVYSNCEEVELVLNGKSLGSQPLPKDASPRKWTVTYEPGVLKTVARNKGEVVATHALRTAGAPAKIVLTTDRKKLAADWDDVSYVTAEIVDENGMPVPGANELVEFKVSGPGAITAVDNGDRMSLESFQGSTRRAFDGQCVAIIKATAGNGPIKVTATAEGLVASPVTIEATPKAR